MVGSPFAAGHWVPEMVEAAAGVNLLSEKAGPSRVVTHREIRDANPEAIVFMPCGYYLEEAEEEAAAIVTGAPGDVGGPQRQRVRRGRDVVLLATRASDRRRARHPGVGAALRRLPRPGRASRGSLSRLVWRDALSSRGDRQEPRHPHDLGKRVSFQFELPNGYVGEAVGVLERWDEDAETYFVRKKDGTQVRVPARASATARWSEPEGYEACASSPRTPMSSSTSNGLGTNASAPRAWPSPCRPDR